jgi:hypothetical protein
LTDQEVGVLDPSIVEIQQGRPNSRDLLLGQRPAELRAEGDLTRVAKLAHGTILVRVDILLGQLMKREVGLEEVDEHKGRGSVGGALVEPLTDVAYDLRSTLVLFAEAEKINPAVDERELARSRARRPRPVGVVEAAIEPEGVGDVRVRREAVGLVASVGEDLADGGQISAEEAGLVVRLVEGREGAGKERGMRRE